MKDVLIFPSMRHDCDSVDGAIVSAYGRCEQCSNRGDGVFIELQVDAESGANLCFECLEKIYLDAKEFKNKWLNSQS